MEQKVILDDRSFKALSADSRVSIMKKLTERRMTLSELSDRLRLRGSTIKEHCDVLRNAELIQQIDEGRKWKYYELTKKGKQIFSPSLFEEAKVLITLCIGILIISGILYSAFVGVGSIGFSANSSQDYAPLSSQGLNDIKALTTESGSQDAAQNIQIDSINYTPEGIPVELYASSVILCLIIGIIIGWQVKRQW